MSQFSLMAVAEVANVTNPKNQLYININKKSTINYMYSSRSKSHKSTNQWNINIKKRSCIHHLCMNYSRNCQKSKHQWNINIRERSPLRQLWTVALVAAVTNLLINETSTSTKDQLLINCWLDLWQHLQSMQINERSSSHQVLMLYWFYLL